MDTLFQMDHDDSERLLVSSGHGFVLDRVGIFDFIDADAVRHRENRSRHNGARGQLVGYDFGEALQSIAGQSSFSVLVKITHCTSSYSVHV